MDLLLSFVVRRSTFRVAFSGRYALLGSFLSPLFPLSRLGMIWLLIIMIKNRGNLKTNVNVGADTN